jgi:hypothetical protein
MFFPRLLSPQQSCLEVKRFYKRFHSSHKPTIRRVSWISILIDMGIYHGLKEICLRDEVLQQSEAWWSSTPTCADRRPETGRFVKIGGAPPATLSIIFCFGSFLSLTQMSSPSAPSRHPPSSVSCTSGQAHVQSPITSPLFSLSVDTPATPP